MIYNFYFNSLNYFSLKTYFSKIVSNRMCSISPENTDSSTQNATDFSHILSYRSLCDALEAASNTDKGIVFIEGKEKEFQMSYAELYLEARRIARYLQDNQIPSNAEIIIQAADNISFVPMFWGCLIGGYKPIPLSLGFTDDHRLKLLHIWELLEHPWLLHNAPESFFPLLNQTATKQHLEYRVSEIQVRHTACFGSEKCDPIEKLPDYSQDDIIFVQFSSGSTGKPKGVSISNRNILDNIYYTTKLQKFGVDDKFFNWMPLTHDMGLIYYHIQGVVLQMDQCQMPTQLFIRYPSLWMHKMSEHRASHSASPNFGYRFFLDYYNKEMSENWDLSCIKYLLNAAEPISLSIYENFASEMEQLGLRRSSLHAGYGLAEATLVVSMRQPGSGMDSVSLDRNKLGVGTKVEVIDPNHPDSLQFALCGKCIDSIEIRFTDDTSSILEAGFIGNIEIRGISVVDGYYRSPDATSAALTSDGWFKTGDLGFRWEEEIVITGRSKEIIFVGGLNYYPHDVEAALHDIEGLGLNKIIASGIQNPATGTEELVLFVKYKAKMDAFQALVNDIKDTLLKRMGLLGHVVIPIKQVPKTTSGKLRRVFLAEQYKSGSFDLVLIETGQKPFLKGHDGSHPTQSEGTKIASERDIVHKKGYVLGDEITTILEKITGLSVIPGDATFDELGINSMKAIQFHEKLEELTSIKIPISVAFDYPSVKKLTEYLLHKVESFSSADPLESIQVDIDNSDDIAITGIAVNLPGEITSLESLWDFLCDGEPSIRPYPANRPNSHDWESVDDNLKLANYLEDIAGFDASFFGITAEEATAMDPQQRLLLESAYHAFEDAGLPVDKLKERNIGVFTGISSSEYRKYITENSQKGPYDITGNLASTAAGRISYIFGLRGPAMSIDTACSSSLVALHQACRAINTGETEIALVSAVNLILDENGTLGLHAVQALSDDGRCKAFDEKANGYGRSEGVISMIVTPLTKAVENNARIYGVIKSTAINHDGRSNGLTAPNGLAQQQLISQNLEKAHLKPGQLVAIETHGTGTRLGDPQELGAWMEILGTHSTQPKPYLSAAKAKLGHLESAAGLAGVLKSVLMIGKGIVPAHKLSSKPTGLINWNSTPFLLPTEPADLSQQPEDRFVSVSSFGLSGTNANVILTGWDTPNPLPEQDNVTELPLFTISARSESALRELADKWLQRLESANENEFNALLNEQLRRFNSYEYRLCIVERTQTELISTLKAKLSQNIKRAPLYRTNTPVAWLFSGQGSQYSAMFKTLFENSESFKSYIKECQDYLNDLDANIELETFILQADERIHLTKFTQPVLAALEISMAKMLADTSLTADVVCGHSLGEIVALCYAGVITEPDMFRLLVHRGALMSGIPERGGMIVAFGDESTVKGILQKHSISIDVASVNTETSVTLSGSKDHIELCQEALLKEGIRCKKLTVEQAFHSTLMDEILDEFNRVATQITYHPAKIPLILNVNGTVLKKGETIDANYLTRQIRETVQFQKCMFTLAELRPSIVLEVGPSAALSPMVAAAGVTDNILCVSDMQHDSQMALMRSLCALYELGLDTDFKPFTHAKYPNVSLPTYPFQHTPFWIKSTTEVPSNATVNVQNVPMDSSINWTSQIKLLVSNSTGFSLDQLHETVNLFELGLDSLVLLKVKAAVKKEFDVEIAASQFFNEANTIEKIAHIVESQVPKERQSNQQAVPEVPQIITQNGSSTGNGSIGNTPNAAIQQLINEQLRLMHRQLDLLQGTQTTPQINANSLKDAVSRVSTGIASANGEGKDQSSEKTSYVAYKSVKNTQSIGQIPKESLQKLIDTYTAMTSASKNEVATYRNWLATSRNIAGFRPDRKEMVYQLHIDRAEGAYVYDIDGNKLLDITMGFGVSLFGNKPDFIEKALMDEMQRGIGVGAMSYRAGRVARKFCELTGHERVAFFNTGSEAVMNAIRIARTYKKRNLVVQFSGAYHGNTDPVLGVSIQKDGRAGAMPMSPGMPESYFSDHLVLDYDNPESLSEIASRANEIAAVIVEPIQSRKPDLQPKSFLKELRSLTIKHGIVLIFDETITGLRVGKNGAQGFFGVKADIATYGKIVGGGLPIGLIAGNSDVMDAVDGGAWNYGDTSYPEVENTFSAGTFNHHPLVLATMEAVLDKVIDEGDLFYPLLEKRTHKLVTTLNGHFIAHNFPISVVHFGSLFRFNVTGTGELLFYKLVTKGVYIWEGRNCFISTAHTNDEIDLLIKAVIEAVNEMRDDGFFPDGSSSKNGSDSNSTVSNSTDSNSPVSNSSVSNGAVSNDNVSESSSSVSIRTTEQHPIQQRLFALSNLDLGDEAYQIRGAMKIMGEFDQKKFEQVCDDIFGSNEAFRTSFSVNQGKLIQSIDNDRVLSVEYIETGNNLIQERITAAICPFEVSEWPLVRITVLKIGDLEHLLIVNVHHIVLDGYSLSLFFEQFLNSYFGAKAISGTKSYSDFVQWQKNYESSPKFKDDEEFWLKVLESNPKPVIPAAIGSVKDFSFDGSRVTKRIAIDGIRSTARKIGVSVYSLVFGAYALWIQRTEGASDFIVGSVAAGRPDGFEKTMGMFVNTIPFRFKIEEQEAIKVFFKKLSGTILHQIDASFYPYNRLLDNIKEERTAGTNPFFETIFSYEKDTQRSVSVGGITFETYDLPRKAAGFPLLFDVIETQDELIIGIEYQHNHYNEARILEIADAYTSLLKNATLFTSGVISDISVPSFDRPGETKSASAEIEEKIYSAARNGTLRLQIAKIWTEVLGVEKINYDTSFFWMGGDSIKAIQIVSRLSDLGLNARINTIFKNPTVNKLASEIEATSDDTTVVSHAEKFGLLPIQSYFFELDLAHSSHWNQAIRLSTSEPINEAIVKNAFETLIERHPILGAKISAKSFDLSKVKPRESLLWDIAPITAKISKDNWLHSMEERFIALQQLQSLSDGKLMSVLFCQFDNEVHLFWGIHHLVTDAVSWQILVNDFNEILGQLIQQKKPALPPVHDYVSRWTALTETFQNSVKDEYEFWEKMTSIKGTKPLTLKACKIGELRTKVVRLQPDTAKKLDKLIQTKGARFAETAIIASVYRVLNTLNGTCWFWNEYHGRRFRDYEISQSIGWFTSMYPVKVNPTADRALSEQLLETLNSVPSHGFGFGYQSKSMLSDTFEYRPQVRFNFLGEFPSKFDQFNVHLIDNHLTIHPENSHDVAMDVNTIKLNGEWIVQIDVNPEVDLSELNKIEAFLIEEIDHISSFNSESDQIKAFFYEQNAPKAETRADFARRHQLNDSDITISDCYPLSPLQQGLLYHAQLKAEIQSGLQQLVMYLDGHLDPQKLTSAIELISKRHASLRTLFSSKLEAPLQIVVDSTPIVVHADYSELSDEEFNSQISELVREDLHTQFDLFSEVPVRFHYVKGPGLKSVLVFTIHHIIYDGWSNDILLRELTSAYNGEILDPIDGHWATIAIESGNKAHQLTEEYWYPYLSDMPDMSPLKWGRSHNSYDNRLKSENEFVVNTNGLDQIQSQIKSLNASVSTLIHAAWGTTLLLLGSKQSATFGTVYSGRYGLSVDADHHIGLFISTVPFKVSFDGNETQNEFIESVGESMIEHHDNSFVSLPELSSMLGVNEIFDSILVIENYPLNASLYPFKEGNNEEVTICNYSFHSEESVPLTVSVNYHPEFKIDIRYNPQQFQLSVIRKIGETFEFVLKTLLESSDATMADLNSAWKRNQSVQLNNKSLGKIKSLKNK